MVVFNAFIGKSDQLSRAEVLAALGPSAPLWTELIDEITADAGNLTQEWKGIYVNKYGWSLRLKQKSRNIIHLSPCKGSFRIVFIFGDRAVKAAKQADLPQSVVEALANAPKYPEGTGLRLTVHRASDLPAIRTLAQIKLAN